MATAGLGSITATPNIAGNRRFKSYLSQSMATTGRTPSPATLDQIIQSELDAMGRRVQEQQRFGLDLARTEEAKRQFDISQNNALDTAKAGRESSLISTGLGAGTTLMGFNALRGKPLLGDTISGGIDKLFGLGKATTPGVVNTGAGMGKGLVRGGVTPFVADPSLAATASGIGAEMVPAAGSFSLPAVNPATGAMEATAAAPLTSGGVAIPPVIQAGETTLGSAAIPAATGTSVAAPAALSGFEGMAPAAIDEAVLTGGAEAGGEAAAGLGLGSWASGAIPVVGGIAAAKIAGDYIFDNYFSKEGHTVDQLASGWDKQKLSDVIGSMKKTAAGASPSSEDVAYYNSSDWYNGLAQGYEKVYKSRYGNDWQGETAAEKDKTLGQEPANTISGWF